MLLKEGSNNTVELRNNNAPSPAQIPPSMHYKLEAVITPQRKR